MTAKIISTYIAAGYSLNSKYSQLTITTSGGIGGTVLYAGSYAQVFNRGVVHASNTVTGAGVYLAAGGSVTNGSATDATALIAGGTGVFVWGDGTVANFGAIDATTYGEG